MNLYNRNFEIAQNNEEQEALNSQLNFEDIKGLKRENNAPKHKHEKYEIKSFLWHNRSLYPNNFLWHSDVKNLDHAEEAEKFKKIIYEAKSENEVQTYIKENRKWFIPASLYKEYNFAHHGAYLFPEQMLGSEYKVDYLLLGKNSDGFHIVLVEFENADTIFTLKSSNVESESVRKGITQLKDWKRWIDSNREYFLRVMNLQKKGIEIPSYRFHYCLVVSRRDKMDEISREVRSQLMYEMSNSLIVSYDRLVENILKLSNGY